MAKRNVNHIIFKLENTVEKQTEEVNDVTIDELVDMFKKVVEAKNLERKTVSSYFDAIMPFFAWCKKITFSLFYK